ncbi:MAG TPA: ATPase domain-containing protein [Candidatus Acidoferrum sp.]|nr:ATPase domain-containing protein [Candidatus Acidoferrum sp.]
MTASSLATLRSKIEADLRGRVASPFAYRDRNAFELVSTGIPEMDALMGGLPRGAMTEICGAAGSGRTSLLLASLAERTANGEVCALVDARDSFDPLTGNAAGIALGKLLWVRCQNLDQALRATDLLIQAGGFGMVAVDLSDVPTRTVRQVPLNAWFRFRRAVEDTPTILLLLEQEPHAKTCASLVVRLEAGEARWTGAGDKMFPQGLKPGESERFMSELKLRPPARCHPFAKLLRGFSVRAGVVRTRIQMPEQCVIDIRVGAQPKMAVPLAGSVAESRIFEASTNWSFR